MKLLPTTDPVPFVPKYMGKRVYPYKEKIYFCQQALAVREINDT
jgi:hypothetical protein